MTKKSVPLPPIVDERVFRKANQVIAPRVTRGGTLSLLGRKIFNVLLYHTQRLRVPGENAPDGDPVYQTLYWLPLSELAKDATYNSDDMSVLKDALLKLQDIRITTDDARGFASDVLLASVRIVPAGRGKKTMLGWGLHAATEQILKNPDFYTRLSIYYLTHLNTTGGIALYEHAKRYATNPGGVTAKREWEYWYDVLTGLPMASEKPEYRYFKRDVLKPAIDEVNRTDIQVKLDEFRDGRRIKELQFKVSRTIQSSLELPPPPVIDSEVIARIEGIGIHKREAEDIFASHEETFLKATLEFVTERAANTKLPPIDSLAALFRAALRGRYADTKKLRQFQNKLEPQKLAPEADPVLLEKRKTILEAFDAMTEEGRAGVLSQFMADNPVLAASVRKNPSGKTVRNALAGWMIKQGN